MTIPRKLKIGGHIFTIKIVDMEGCGQTKRTTNEILISKDLIQSQKEATLFHEIIHAINNEINHTILDSFAEQLYQIFHDNKLLK